MAKKEKKPKKEKVVVESPVELTKYYFLADVYAVVAVEAEDASEAKQMVKELSLNDFINFRVKKAKLINPKLYAPKDEEEDEEEDTDEYEDDDEPKKKGKKRRRDRDEDEEMEPSMA